MGMMWFFDSPSIALSTTWVDILKSKRCASGDIRGAFQVHLEVYTRTLEELLSPLLRCIPQFLDVPSIVQQGWMF